MTTDEQSCCAPMHDELRLTAGQHAPEPTPGRPRSGDSLVFAAVSDQRSGNGVGSTGPHGRHDLEQAEVPEQFFGMGDADDAGNAGDGETPVHEVWVDAFTIDATTVTNAAFARFVAETGYRTESERFGYSAVFHLALQADLNDVVGQPPSTPWWLGVRGADWAHPAGPRSAIGTASQTADSAVAQTLDEHPVVQVSWNDAVAYCAWAGRRLPTEAEWECAARGGLAGARYPWGEEWDEGERCNIWQGSFPAVNTLLDGWLTTAPVRTFEPNGYGLWQSVGNVWEWCADWWAEDYYARSPARNPTGPATGDQRSMRGGSYLCHDSYCNRYRNSARASNTADSAAGNIGFRTVALA